MLQINLFRSPLNTQSETIYIEATQKAIKDCLDIDFEYALIYVNGYQVDKDYILKEDDVCTIRQTHGLITSLVTGIQAAVNGRSFTDQWDSNKKDIQKKISDWLAEGNEEPDAPTNKNVDTTTQTIPQLAGAKNASAYGKYVPLVLGRSIYTSNYCGNQYRTISGTDGEKQTFHCLYLLGYKDIQVQDIKLGMTLLSSNPNLRDNGVFQNSEIDGRWDAETYNIQLELEQGSDVSIYPQKVSEEQLNIELLNTGTKKLELNRFSAKNPQTIEIEFTLNGLIGYSENGDEQEKSVQVQIKISFDGGTTYEPFGQIVGTGITYDSSTGVSTITRKKNKVMRFIATRTLTASEALSCENGVAELYIARNNAQAEGNNQFDKIYLSGIRTWCFDPKLSTSSALVAQKPVDSVRTSLTARLGISIEADEIEFKGQLEALNCILTAKGRTYSNGSWSSTLSPTTNPASMALLVLQHPSRGKYAYTDSQIDMDAFGEFYEWCNQPREQGDNTPKFQCNGVMTAKKKTKDYIDAILDCGRGSFLYNSRKISVWIDKPRDTPVMVLNNQNILSQQNNKTLDDLPDGYKCKFVNEITWQTDEWDIIINPNAGANPVYESIDLIFQTNPKQIYQNMMYLYAKNKLRPETWKPRVSVDGNLLDIGSLIEIQNDTLSVGIGDGAEIKELVTDNGYITQIKTDGNMYIDDLTQEYGIKVTCADGVHEPKVMTYKVVPSATGEQSVFTFDTPILESATYKPNVGDIISFGFLDRITTQALCFGKKDNGDGTFDLTLVPYQEGVYTADSGEIPEFKTNVSDIPQRDRGTYEPDKTAERFAEVNQKIDEIETGTADIGEPDDITGLSAVAKQDRISISWNPLGNGLQNTIKRYYVEIKKGNGNWQSLPSTTANTTEYIFNRNTDGYPEYSVLDTWKVRVKAENIYGVLSEDWTEENVNTSSYGTWIPASPSFDAKIPDEGGISFSWSKPTSSISGRTLYGTPKYTVTVKYADTEHSVAEQTMATLVTNDLSTVYNFDRAQNKDGYPERVATADWKGLDRYTFTISVNNESNISNPPTSTAVGFNSAEISAYGTWRPAVPSFRIKDALENGIDCQWFSARGLSDLQLYGGVKYKLHVSYITDATTDPATEVVRGVVDTDSLGAFYEFVRATDGYPEKSTVTGATVSLGNYRLRLEAINTVAVQNDGTTHYSTLGTAQTVNESNYLTWIPHELTGDYAPRYNIVKRCATILFPPQNDVYGTLRYGLLINNTAKDGTTYYTPKLTNDPYASEDDYKESTQTPYMTTTTFKQNLPLEGQNMTCVQVDRYDLETRGGVESTEHKAISREYYICNAQGESAFDAIYGSYFDWDLIPDVSNPPSTLTDDWVVDYISQDDFTTRYATVQKINAPMPVATEYNYKIYAENIPSGNSTQYAPFIVTASANSINDIVDNAITSTKLSDQCVTTEKIASGAITAEQIAVGNLLAKGAWAGTMHSEGLITGNSGFWADKEMRYDYVDPNGVEQTYTTQAGEFFVGNNPNHETAPTSNDEYIHFKPATTSGGLSQFWIAIKNIVFQTMQTIVKGIFRVKANITDTDANAFLTVNPTSTDDAGTPAQTAKVNGTLQIGSVSSPKTEKIYGETSVRNSDDEEVVNISQQGEVTIKGLSEFFNNTDWLKFTKNGLTLHRNLSDGTWTNASLVFKNSRMELNVDYINGSYFTGKAYEAENAANAKQASVAYSTYGFIMPSINSVNEGNVANKTARYPGVDFYYYTGLELFVNLQEANTVRSALTLNISNRGAKTIKWNGVVTSSSHYAMPAGLYKCYYDGTYWNMTNTAEVNSAVTATTASNLNGTVQKAIKSWTQLDLSSLDASKWFPVTVYLGTAGFTEIECYVSLDSGTKPSWSSHNNGFTCHLHLLVMGSGWGTTSAQTLVLDRQYSFTTVNGVTVIPTGWTQMTNSSTGVLWLRGGGKYRVWNNKGETFTIRTSSYTSQSQTVSPTTSYQWSFSYAQLVGTISNANFASQADISRGTALCDTDGSVQAKVASMRGFTFANGQIFPISFTKSNTYNGTITLNINSTGAKTVYINNEKSSSTNKTLPAGTYLCIADGGYYKIETSWGAPFAKRAQYASSSGSSDSATRAYFLVELGEDYMVNTQSGTTKATNFNGIVPVRSQYFTAKSGYIVYMNGLCIQWVSGYDGSEHNTTLKFPLAFANTDYIAFPTRITVQDDGGSVAWKWLGVHSKLSDKQSFTCRTRTAGSGDRWVGIGWV